MSASENETDMNIPCVLVTSCDVAFKEEELIKRKISEVSVHVLAKMLTSMLTPELCLSLKLQSVTAFYAV